MNFLPIGISVRGTRVAVIGGGKVASQKLRTLTSTTARIVVYATAVSQEVRQTGVEWHEEPYRPEQLAGARLVYACTSDSAVNHAVAEEARRRGSLVNVADDPAWCDFVSPALWTEGAMSVAVLSDGTAPRRSVLWRNALRERAARDPLPR